MIGVLVQDWNYVQFVFDLQIIHDQQMVRICNNPFNVDVLQIGLIVLRFVGFGL
jgi:hypothetical protein